jgi:hypothetical protein
MSEMCVCVCVCVCVYVCVCVDTLSRAPRISVMMCKPGRRKREHTHTLTDRQTDR